MPAVGRRKRKSGHGAGHPAHVRQPHDPRRAHRPPGARLVARTKESARADAESARTSRAVSLELAGRPAAGRLGAPRPRLARMGRRRHRVRRPARRVRRDARRARAPGHRAGGAANASRSVRTSRSRTDTIVVADELAAPLRSAAVALRQLRHRSDDGRDPPHARRRPAARGSSRSKARTTVTTTSAGLACTRIPKTRDRRVTRTRCAPTPASRPMSPPHRHRAVRRPRRGRARVLAEYPGEIAGMILEPTMMNISIIPPPDGYLAGLATCCTRTARSCASTR